MRRLFNVSAVISLLICLASIWACARSFGVQEDFRFNGKVGVTTSWLVTNRAGDVAISRFHDDRPWAEDRYFSHQVHYLHGRVGLYDLFHLPWVFGEPNTRPDGSVVENTVIFVPWLLISIATAALPCVWLLRRFTRRKRMPGTCGHCGYDLRASPDRCPECGIVVSSVSQEVK
jgi:hypothetical protein